MNHVRKTMHVYPGSNTPRGFYSYYHHILPHDRAERIFVLKGGPGVGKSSFMKRIGEAAERDGLMIEYHHCSADDDSLDAVVLPQIGIALLDGTAPHVVDPRSPGAVDEILNFGAFWDEDGIRSHKREILETNDSISRCYQRGYRYLAASRAVYDDIEAINSRLIDRGALNQMAESLIDELMGGRSAAPRPGRIRRLFGTAITPAGPKNHLDTLLGPLAYKVVVRGQPGTGKSTLIEKVVARASELGLDVEAYHCPFDPQRVEHVVVLALDLAITTSAKPHEWTGSVDLEVNTDEALDETAQAKDSAMIAQAQETHRHLFDYAVAALSDARKLHDQLEEFYIPYMDFTKVDELFHEVQGKILGAARGY